MIGLILQARINSSRLLGKILLPLKKKTMIEYQLERIKLSKSLDKVILATTNNSKDDLLVKLLGKKIKIFRGSEHNVLMRYYKAAKKYKLKTIVRCQSDCPLIDPKIIDDIVKFYKKNSKKYDYVSNILKPSYPIGMHIEVFSFDSLEEAYKKSTLKIEQEHVTPYIYRRPKKFNLYNYSYKNKSFSKVRLTVDFIEDYYLIKNITEKIKSKNINLEDILNFYKKNKILFRQNSKFKKKSTV